MTAALAPKFAVYRLFNADGHLLYVGSTPREFLARIGVELEPIGDDNV